MHIHVSSKKNRNEIKYKALIPHKILKRKKKATEQQHVQTQYIHKYIHTRSIIRKQKISESIDYYIYDKPKYFCTYLKHILEGQRNISIITFFIIPFFLMCVSYITCMLRVSPLVVDKSYPFDNFPCSSDTALLQ